MTRVRMSLRAVTALFAAIAALATIGCAAYSRVDERYRDDRSGLELELPAGWLRLNAARPDFVMTRDGLRLERVAIDAVDVDHELKETKRVFRSDMTPYDMAELALSLIGADERVREMRLTRIDALRIAGNSGFVADAAFVDPHGLAMRMRLYGAIMPGKSNGAKARAVQVSYAAPATGYFDRFLPVVEQMMSAARVANR